MKIVSKNHSLTKGVRGYLVYLMDDNNNPIECYEVFGDESRIEKENELSMEYDIDGTELEYVSLQEFKYQTHVTSDPLFLVFYLGSHLFNDKMLLSEYAKSIQSYLESRGDNVRMFFLPTDGEEKIECINPKYIQESKDLEILEKMIEDIKTKFDVGVE